ncbi:Nitrite and sulphite reductase 4Fe-4S domain-containing protein [Paenibacillus sp. cl141a]|uniref:nitrite reductase n=1 Tax=unclassified Paenibacillus TaxID=185978 RepID=UPI0001789228|nr:MULTISPECIES: nitrite reductase [unclassified Paenibacillus]ACX68296.1 nitrite and sulphite reductase 4Fe-4S region [Paenibacillus sp. Y412MC10]SEL24048.1 Nitrite and sulphite reductase 4Fe-4S domain-containing protein [Paenibacillus sp. cl141a]
MAMQKFAVTPGFEVGGTLFRPDQLAVLGSIVGDDARIEMTTFKQLYVEMDEERVEEAKAKLEAAGLEVHPAGFVSKSLITCNFCRGAEDSGLDVAKMLDEAIADHPVPNPLKIGYAGCALGTSEPLLKDIAVIKMRNTYDIYVGGEPRGLKASLAKQLHADLTPDQLAPIILKLIAIYQEHGKKKERFSRFVERMTLDHLRQSTLEARMDTAG